MFKKTIILFLLAFCANWVFAQNSVSLDAGIEDVANFLNDRIPVGASVGVFNFSSDSLKLSKHIVDELTIALTNVGVFVVDRNNLDEVHREELLGESGVISEETAQEFGRGVGAQTVILGSMTKYNETTYRLRVQAIAAGTKQVQAGRTVNVKLDAQLLSLLNIKVQKEYRFTREEKTNAGFKNMLFGWGSFQMGDPLGGGVSIGMELISLASLIIGIQPLLSDDGQSVFWSDSKVKEVDYSSSDSFEEKERKIKEREESRKKQDQELRDLHTTLAVVGAGGLVLSWTWGFVRPHLYDKPVSVQKAANVIDHLNIGLIPMNDGTASVRVSLNYSF